MRNPIQIGCLLLGLILLSLPANAGRHYEDDLQWWIPVTLELSINDKLSTQLQVESRFAENLREHTLRAITPSISYEPNKHVELTLAAGPYFSFHPDFKVEKRIYQQVRLEKKWRLVTLSLRGRIEERFLPDVKGVSLRNRYMLQAQGPIGKTPFYWVTSDEIHFNLNSPKDGPQRGINQNRLYLGMGQRLGKQMSIEGGYQLRINHVIDQPDEMEHIILTKVSYCLR